jgi:hypothetical protein
MWDLANGHRRVLKRLAEVEEGERRRELGRLCRHHRIVVRRRERGGQKWDVEEEEWDEFSGA